MDIDVINRYFKMANTRASIAIGETAAECRREIAKCEDSIRSRKARNLPTEEEETYLYNLKIAETFLERYAEKTANNTSIFI